MPARLPTLHPLLISAYPIVYLYGANVGKMSPWEVVLPIAAAWAVVGTLWLIVAFLFQDRRFGAVVASLFAILFCLTIPAFQSVRGLGVPKFGALALLGAVFATGVTLLIWKRRALGWLSTFLNILAGVTFLLLLATTIPRAVSVPGMLAGTQDVTLTAAPDARKPDIYFVVLDGYGRSDVLKELYAYDNAPFVRKLQSMGFYVADRSLANYPQTLLSLASTLNMTYLDEVARRVGTGSQDRSPLQSLVAYNQVVLSLKSVGYRFDAFSSGFSGTDSIQRVDSRLSPGFELTEFHNLLLSLSPVPAILDNLRSPASSDWQFEAHRRRIHYIFATLASLPRSARPRFVFAHVVSPHPPFIFGPEGERVDPARNFSFDDASHYVRHASVAEYVRGYSNQARYISGQIAGAAAAILARDPEAIVIIQGDHGPGSRLMWNSYEESDMRERMAILNAYYVPAAVKAGLRPDISPVNTFRLLLNHLFGSGLPPLPDEAYFATWRAPYEFRKVTEKVNPPAPARATSIRAGLE